MDPRVSLTRPWPEDAPAIAAALADWDTVRGLTAVPWPYDEADAHRFVASAPLDEFAIRRNDRLVGMIRAGSSFGLWIAGDAQGQGIGRRASVLALSRRFRDDASDVTTHRLADNHRSARLLNWLGFRETGSEQIWSSPLGRPVDAVALSLSLDDFASRHALSLTTRRLRLEPLRPDDLPALAGIATQPPVARMLMRFHPGMAPAEVAAIMSEGGLVPPLRLTVRQEGRVVGWVGLSAEPDAPMRLSYALDPAVAGQGLGQEMVAAFFDEVVARFAPAALEATVFLDNSASRKILKNLGFRRMEDMPLQSRGRDAPAEAAIYRWRPGLLT